MQVSERELIGTCVESSRRRPGPGRSVSGDFTRTVRAAPRAVFRLAFLACVVCPIADLQGLPRAGVEAQETTPDVTAGGEASDGQGAEARPGAPRVDAR